MIGNVLLTSVQVGHILMSRNRQEPRGEARGVAKKAQLASAPNAMLERYHVRGDFAQSAAASNCAERFCRSIC
jgi:hypothetical protein